MKATCWFFVFALGCGSTSPVMPAAEPEMAAPEAAAEAAPAAAPAPVGEVTIVDGQLVLPGPIGFEGESATLTAESDAALGALRDFLAKRTDVTLLRIEGHVAASGEPGLMMSGERAFSVGRWLRDQGIDCKRLLAAAFGDSKPIAAPSSPEAASHNTRITLVPAMLRSIAIGGMPVDGSAALSTDVCPE